jgi:hypothetical protein
MITLQVSVLGYFSVYDVVTHHHDVQYPIFLLTECFQERVAAVAKGCLN